MTTPHELWKILGSEGLLGFRHTEDGDVRIPWQMNIHTYRELAQLSGGLAIAAFAHSQLGVQAFHFFGTPEQQKRYMVPGMDGDAVIAFANTEPGAGSDASALTTTAERDGDEWVINGTKAYITNGDLSDHVVFTAVTDPGAARAHRGISQFAVDGDADGLTRMRMQKYGWKESHLSTLRFEDVRIPAENMIGEPERGFYQTMDIFNSSRIGIAALALGTALGSYRMAYDHVRRRKAFGKTLFEHESKRVEFADNLARLEAGWLLVEKAAWLSDTGRESRANASMAKLFNTEEGMGITQWATEAFGARGVMATHPVAEYPHDAKAALLGEGAPEVQKKIIAENIDSVLDEM